MDTRRGSLLVLLSLIGAHSGCGGGQTGQPTAGSGGGGGCDDTGACDPVCEEVGWEDEVHGVSARSTLDAHGRTREVPFFWVEIPEDDFAPGFDVSALEPDEVEATELSIELTANEGASVLRCEDELWVPVHVRLATLDGLTRSIETTLVARPVSAAPGVIQLEQVDLEGAFDPGQSQSQCLPLLASGPLGWRGRFCDEGRLGLLGTPCGGVVQAAPDQAPFGSQPSPIEALSELDHFTMVWNDLPPIEVAVRLDDPTACWTSETAFVLDAVVTIESGGVIFSEETAAGGGFSEAPTGDSRMTTAAFAEVCGDVSSSPDWSRVLDGRPSSGELCIHAILSRQEDGETSFFAGASLDGLPSGWAGWELASP